VDANYGQVLGLFPVNILHNIVHILFGLVGPALLQEPRRFEGLRQERRHCLCGADGRRLHPGLSTMFGLVPLFGNDIWLHALLAAVAAYFGWMHRDVAVSDRS
jgi:hypothetical protein